jgi:hypothetical protein
MVNQAASKIYRSNGRHSLYLPSDIVSDDRFPFKAGEALQVRIDGERLIVEKPKGKS